MLPPRRPVDPFPPPPGVWIPAGFFALAGFVELGFSYPFASLGKAWEALGRALMHWLLAAGLWHRSALCRAVALVYCLSSVIVYAFALLLAYAQAPVEFPAYVVSQSLFQVPACVVLYRWLRTPEAARLHSRRLFS